MFSHYYYYYYYECRGTQIGKHIEPRKTDLLQTHPGERNSISVFRPFQTLNSGFLFSSFFWHRPGTPVKWLSIKGNAAFNDGPKVCYIYQRITHHWGRHFHFMLPDFYSPSLKAAFLLNDLCTWQLHGKYPNPFKFEKKGGFYKLIWASKTAKFCVSNLLPPTVVVVVARKSSCLWRICCVFVSEKM